MYTVLHVFNIICLQFNHIFYLGSSKIILQRINCKSYTEVIFSSRLLVFVLESRPVSVTATDELHLM